MDVTSESEVDSGIAAVVEAFGRIDVAGEQRWNPNHQRCARS